MNNTNFFQGTNCSSFLGLCSLQKEGMCILTIYKKIQQVLVLWHIKVYFLFHLNLMSEKHFHPYILEQHTIWSHHWWTSPWRIIGSLQLQHLKYKTIRVKSEKYYFLSVFSFCFNSKILPFILTAVPFIILFWIWLVGFGKGGIESHHSLW